jgi:osmoprotectant transport system substrate-binding protein
MRHIAPRRLTALAALLGLTLVVAACGGGSDSGTTGTSGSGSAGGSASKIDLSGASFTVGSKEFTEQLILGQITIQALEAAGAKVTDQTGLEGSTAARKALTSGDTDMYWEYTGTAWGTYLGHDQTVPDQQKQFQKVKLQDAANGIAWVDLAPMNNTYAIAVRSDAGPKLDAVKSLSDLAQLSRTDPDLVTLCVGEEFATRPDGLPGVAKKYGMDVSKDQVSLVGDSVVYSQVAKGDRCNFGSVFATDGRIGGLHLRVLADDEHFFPFYNAALSIRKPVLDKYPQVKKLFKPVAEALTTEQATKLNARVDVDGEKPETVAHDFLVKQGVIS